MQTPDVLSSSLPSLTRESLQSLANPKKSNPLVATQFIILEMLRVLHEVSISERKSLDAQRLEMVELANKQASAKGMQGWIAAASGAVELASAFIPMAPCFGDRKASKPLIQITQKVVGTLNNTGAKFVGSKFEVKELLASTDWTLASKRYDNLSEENRNKTNSSESLKRVAEEARDVTKRVSSANN